MGKVKSRSTLRMKDMSEVKNDKIKLPPFKPNTKRRPKK